MRINTPMDNDNPTELAYDLRQYYANILGEHLIDASEHRKKQSYYLWFKALEDIKTITKHKWANKTKSIINYDKLINEIKQLANKSPSVWLGKDISSKDSTIIENKLRELEEFLYEEMEKGHIFGEGYRVPGLT